MDDSKKLNEDGFEQSFMVNYIAPFILCTGLLDILKKNTPVRIINVNAGLYVKGNLDIDKTPKGDDFHRIKTYANSKLCNAMFTIDFAKQIEGTGISINAVHPGVINTDLGKFDGVIGLFLKGIKNFGRNLNMGH